MTPALLSTLSKHTPRQSTRLENVRLTLSVTFTSTDTPCVVSSLLTVATSPLRAAVSSCVAACAYKSTLYTHCMKLTHKTQLHLFHIGSVFLFIKDVNCYIIMGHCLPVTKLGPGLWKTEEAPSSHLSFL